MIYSRSVREAFRQHADPDIIYQFYHMITCGINPVIIGDPGNQSVVPDPSPHAISPTLQQKSDAMRIIMERRDGLPAQSIQIDAEVRQKMEMLGTGVPTELLALNNPRTLDLLKMALAEAMGNIEDAELEPDSADLNTNSPPSSEDSEL
jgi:hypothetical protein